MPTVTQPETGGGAGRGGLSQLGPEGDVAAIDTTHAIRRGITVALFWLAILVLLSLALLRWVVDTEGVDTLLRLRAEVRLLPLFAGTLLMFGGILFMGFRWQALLPRAEGVSGFVLAAIVASGMLLNVALPGPVGEVAAAALVQRRYGIEAPLALAASLHGRFVGLATSALLAFLVWLFVPLPVAPESAPLVAGAAVVVAVGAIMLGVVAIRPGVLLFWSDISLAWVARRRWGRVSLLASRLERLVRQFVEALAQLGRNVGRAHLMAMFWCLCGVVSVVSGVWLASLALGVAGSPAGLLFSHCAVTAGAVVLFALPVGQVGWDAGFATLLYSTAALPLENALAITVLVRFQQLLIIIAGAGFLMYWLRARGR